MRAQVASRWRATAGLRRRHDGVRQAPCREARRPSGRRCRIHGRRGADSCERQAGRERYLPAANAAERHRRQDLATRLGPGLAFVRGGEIVGVFVADELRPAAGSCCHADRADRSRGTWDPEQVENSSEAGCGEKAREEAPTHDQALIYGRSLHQARLEGSDGETESGDDSGQQRTRSTSHGVPFSDGCMGTIDPLAGPFAG